MAMLVDTAMAPRGEGLGPYYRAKIEALEGIGKTVESLANARPW